MVVTNMTHAWTLVRRVFHLKSFTGDLSDDGSVRGMRRHAAEIGSAEEDEGQAQGVPDIPAREFSIPFADIGGLLPPRPSISKTHTSGSFGRMHQKQRPSSVPAFATNPPQMDRLANASQQAEVAPTQGRSSPPPNLLADTQVLRNPAAAENHLPRGLRRIDSVTLLGLPDVALLANGGKGSHSSRSSTSAHSR